MTTWMTPGVNARPLRRMGTFLVHWNLTSDTRILVYSEQEIRVWDWNNARHLGGGVFFFSFITVHCPRNGEGYTPMGSVAPLSLVAGHQLQSQEQIQAGMCQVSIAMAAFKEREQGLTVQRY